MLIECVRFGDAHALEVRSTLHRAGWYYQFMMAAAANANDTTIPAIPEQPGGRVLDDYEDACFAYIERQVANPRLRWLMLCSQIEMFRDDDADEFQREFERHFGSVPSCCWMLDRETRRLFCVPFAFAPPIFQMTLLAGVILRSREHRPATNCWDDDADSNPVDSGAPQNQLTRLRDLMYNGKGNGDAAQSPEVDVTEFHIGDAKMWCGEACNIRVQRQWLAQQLNVWFNTPATEPCWVRPDSRQDVFRFRVAVLDEVVTPDTTEDGAVFQCVAAPTHLNSMIRYPRGDVVCNTPQGAVGIGHLIPLIDEAGADWLAVNRMVDVRLFRVYRTQYAFVYTLLPDDNVAVARIKSTLKRSTDSNPSLAQRSNVAERSNSEERVVPLVATLPTLECERYVRSVFQENWRHRYRLFYCARFDNLATRQTRWIPVCPK